LKVTVETNIFWALKLIFEKLSSRLVGFDKLLSRPRSNPKVLFPQFLYFVIVVDSGAEREKNIRKRFNYVPDLLKTINLLVTS
jgi:hypothetical protein